MEKKIDLGGVLLETQRLYLRCWDWRDLEDLYAYAQDPQVGPRAGWEPHASLEVSKRILQLFIQGKKTFALELKENAQVIGSLGIEDLRWNLEGFERFQGREIGYVLKKTYWNQGLMSEAVEAAITYCFEAVKLDYLFCGHFEENTASKRVIQKAGFEFLKEIDLQDQRGLIHPTLLYVKWNPLLRIPAKEI